MRKCTCNALGVHPYGPGCSGYGEAPSAYYQWMLEPHPVKLPEPEPPLDEPHFITTREVVFYTRRGRFMARVSTDGHQLQIQAEKGKTMRASGGSNDRVSLEMPLY